MPSSFTGTSAAQNGLVIKICSQCGALLYEDASACAFCDAPLEQAEENLETVNVAAKSSPSATTAEPKWREEVARRLEVYRARRGKQSEDPGEATPFREENEEGESQSSIGPARAIARIRPVERVEIRVQQQELDFSGVSAGRLQPLAPEVPMASMSERRRAGLLDVALLAATYAGFLGLFHALGGQVSLDKVGGVVIVTTLFLLYAIYFSLFTTLGGATPGMQIRGLVAVRSDGHLPDTGQLIWRSFGYLLSGGTLLLGYLWSLWDEDHLTWQDRISQTYITSAEPLEAASALRTPGGHHRFAHK